MGRKGKKGRASGPVGLRPADVAAEQRLDLAALHLHASATTNPLALKPFLTCHHGPMPLFQGEETSVDGQGTSGGSLSVAGGAVEVPNPHGYFAAEESEEDEEVDEDYRPPDAWRKEIRIGPEFQASLPDLGAPDSIPEVALPTALLSGPRRTFRSRWGRSSGDPPWDPNLWRTTCVASMRSS